MRMSLMIALMWIVEILSFELSISVAIAEKEKPPKLTCYLRNNRGQRVAHNIAVGFPDFFLSDFKANQNHMPKLKADKCVQKWFAMKKYGKIPFN